MASTKRNCDNCGKVYLADNRNLNRGWGLCCDKICAAEKREKSKPGYSVKKVIKNNAQRKNYDNWLGLSKEEKEKLINEEKSIHRDKILNKLGI